MISPLSKLKAYYETFDQASFECLKDIYAKEVVFADPLHKIQGVEALEAYFRETCTNLTYCRFIFTEEIVNDTSACLKWQMEYSHKSLKNNARLSLTGTSIIQFSAENVTSQEDFYDMGSMLYEHIPLLGGAIRLIKSRMIKST